jgi:osmotically-inducible protein OsmY
VEAFTVTNQKEYSMNSLSKSMCALAVGLAFSAGAMGAMSKDEFKAGKTRIADEYKTAKAACASQSANAKDICMAEAKGKEKVAKAELDAGYKPSAKADANVGVAKADAAYSVAKEKCDDMSSADKKACMDSAKSAHAKAKADASATMKSTPVAAGTKREGAGDYVEDSVITTKVKAALIEEPALKSTDIKVITTKGVVQLSGFVGTAAAVDKAAVVAAGVKGATSVKNDLVVKGK